MKTETKTTTETEVELHDTWVDGNCDTYTDLGIVDGVVVSRLHEQVSASVFLHTNNISLDIDRHIWVGDKYISNDLGRVRLSMPELEMLAETLNKFIQACKSGDIQPR